MLRESFSLLTVWQDCLKEHIPMSKKQSTQKTHCPLNNIMRRELCIVLILSFFICLSLFHVGKTNAARVGSVDLSFGNNGKVITSVGSGNNYDPDIAIQPDGKIVVTGRSPNGFTLIRYNLDGSLDASFGINGIVITLIGNSSTSKALVIQSDGKIVVVGTSRIIYEDFTLARYNPDGSLDTTFDSDGMLTTDFGISDYAYDLAIQPDGKIVAVGSVQVGGKTKFGAARYNSDGSLDTSFSEDGKVITFMNDDNDNAYSVKIQTDGKIVVAGNSPGIFNHDIGIVRYNADGSLDISFDNDGRVFTFLGNGSAKGIAVEIQTDGKIVASAGRSINGKSEFVLVRYNLDGSPDFSFGKDGGAFTDFGESVNTSNLTIQPNGKIIIIGAVYTGGVSGSYKFALARYNPDGSLDRAFDLDGKFLTEIGRGDSATAAAVQSDGKIVVAGYSKSTDNGNYNFSLTRVNGDSSVLASNNSAIAPTDRLDNNHSTGIPAAN
jgi:uncharacterized delta-60 repeat protein